MEPSLPNGLVRRHKNKRYTSYHPITLDLHELINFLYGGKAPLFYNILKISQATGFIQFKENISEARVISAVVVLLEPSMVDELVTKYLNKHFSLSI